MGRSVSIAVGLVSALVAITLGTMVGAIAGYFGGFIDSVLMRITDMFISLPTLPLLLLVIYLFQDSMRARFGIVIGTFLLIVFIIGALNWMPVSRLVRGSFLSIKEKEFIEAARRVGVYPVDHLQAHPAERAEPSYRGRDARSRPGDHHGVDTFLPGSGLPARHADMGPVAEQRAGLRSDRAVDGDLPRYGDLLDGALHQLCW